MTSTEEGRQIDESDEHLRNVQAPVIGSREPDSNVTVESDRHFSKQFMAMKVTVAGM
jgi:hypothetical protein